jgi:hypothetical protein
MVLAGINHASLRGHMKSASAIAIFFSLVVLQPEVAMAQGQAQTSSSYGPRGSSVQGSASAGPGGYSEVWVRSYDPVTGWTWSRASASAQGARSESGKEDLVPFDAPIYVANNSGTYLGNSNGWWLVAGYKRVYVAPGTAKYFYDYYDSRYSYGSLNTGPGDLVADASSVKGVVKRGATTRSSASSSYTYSYSTYSYSRRWRR